MLRVLARVLGPILLASFLVVGVEPSAYACSCAGSSLTQDLRQADGVFIGRTGLLVSGDDSARYVDVRHVYKGDPAPVVEMQGGQEDFGVSSSCDLDLPFERRLLFLSEGGGRMWRAYACSTRPRWPNESVLQQVERVLGPAHHPTSPTAPSAAQPEPAAQTDPVWPGAFVWVAAGLSVAGAGLLLLRRRRNG